KVTGSRADRYDRDTAKAPQIRQTLACLQTAIDILNDILSLAPQQREADERRCRALLKILQDEANLGASRDRWTPLQRVLIRLLVSLEAQFTRLTEDLENDPKTLVWIS